MKDCLGLDLEYFTMKGYIVKKYNERLFGSSLSGIKQPTKTL